MNRQATRHIISKTMKKHHEEAIKSLSENGQTSIAESLIRCGVAANRRALRQHEYFHCRHIFCPYCRRDRISSRISKHVNRFDGIPQSDLAMITLLFQPHKELIASTAPPSSSPKLGDKNPRGKPVAKIDIETHRVRYSRFLAQTFDHYIQSGGIEFEWVEEKTCGARKKAFIESFPEPWGQDGGAFVSHAHFVFAAWKNGRALTRAEIANAFHAEYSTPCEVRVGPPLNKSHTGRRLSPRDAIIGFICYAMKSFTALPGHRLAELCRFDNAVTKHFYAFNRYRKPKEEETTKMPSS